MSQYPTVEYVGGARRAMPVSVRRLGMELAVDEFPEALPKRNIPFPVSEVIEQYRAIIADQEWRASKELSMGQDGVAFVCACRASAMRNGLKVLLALPVGSIVKFYKYAGKTRMKFSSN